jgi:putative NIF3 family GTP cyclohydrolase 1 type 2
MGVPVHRRVAILESLAPLDLAADWDNVGHLIEPPGQRQVARELLTIDLTDAILDEAS